MVTHAVYSPDQVAEILNLHVRTVRRYIREGRIKASRIGKQYRIAASELDGLVGSDRPEIAGSRRRRVLVSTTVDIEAIGPNEMQRITTALSGAFTTNRESRSGERLDYIYYEEQGRLRVIVHAELETANGLLALLSLALNQ